MAYIYDEEAVAAIFTGLTSLIPTGILSIVTYVLTALGLYTIAKRRGLNHPWLAWIPVVDVWLLGSLSDQYRYLTRGENKSKRKTLLILRILSTALGIAMLALVISAVVQIVLGAVGGMSEEALLEAVLGLLVSVFGLLLPLAGVSIAYVIIRYMALYDLYKSMDPGNCVLFLVLSIIFSITEPFFIFLNRENELGMPPRKQTDIPRQPPREPWSGDETNYL